MWSNIFGEVKLGEDDYTVFWENAEKKLRKKRNIFAFLIKTGTYVKYHV